MNEPRTDFSSVTEVTGYNVTQDQLDRALTRYLFAQKLAVNKEVLEIACGSGQGLGLLAETAKRVCGIDIDPKLVNVAQATYKGRPKIFLDQGNATCLSFPDSSFDLVILFEALYYLPLPNRFLDEALRVLRPGGEILICTANKDWRDFNPSPFSYSYHSAPELKSLLSPSFIDHKAFASSPAKKASIFGLFTGLLKRFAIRCRLMPQTMAGKEFLKRIFLGKLRQFPAELELNHGKEHPVVPISLDVPCADFKVIFFHARKPR